MPSKPVQLTSKFTPGMRALPADDLEAMRQTLLGLSGPGGMGYPYILDAFLGKIDATGQADYTDARYWVKTHTITNADGDSKTAWSTTARAGDHPRYRQITATNLSELAAGTHSVPSGTYVWVLKIRDASSPPVERFFFISRAAAWVEAATQVFVSDGSPPAGYENYKIGYYYDNDANYLAEQRAYFKFPCTFTAKEVRAAALLSALPDSGTPDTHPQIELKPWTNQIDGRIRVALVNQDFDAGMTWATQPTVLAGYEGNPVWLDGDAGLRGDGISIVVTPRVAVGSESTAIYGLRYRAQTPLIRATISNLQLVVYQANLKCYFTVATWPTA